MLLNVITTDNQCLNFLSVAVIKHSDLKQLGRIVFISVYTSRSVLNSGIISSSHFSL